MRMDRDAVRSAISDYDRMRRIILEMHPELCEGDDFLSDAALAETSFEDLIEYIAKKSKEDEAMAAGLKKYIEELCDRAARLKKASDNKKSIIKEAMLAIGKRTLKTKTATLTVRDLENKITIAPGVEVGLIPEEYRMRKVVESADMEKISSDVMAGLDLDFVVIESDRTSLSIRIK